MKQKRVSFKVAKAIKEAGYPQGWKCDEHYCLESEGEYCYQIGDLVSVNAIYKNCLNAISAPTYLDVWLWLWREKKVELSFSYGSRLNSIDEILYCLPLIYHAPSHPNMKHVIQEMNYASSYCSSHGHKYNNHEYADPEDAIIAAIDYLVDNNLLK